MRENERITLNNILQHKEYFDDRLIKINENLDHKVMALRSKSNQLEARLQTYKKKNHDMINTIKDLESKNYTTNKKYLEQKNENDDLMEYLKKIQEEIEKVKKENEKQKKEIEQQEKEIKEQRKIIDKLKFQNSTNSNLPSSLDILGHTKAKKPKEEGTGTRKQRGGQKNHPVHKSKTVRKPDHIRKVIVKKAPTGAEVVTDDEGNIKYYRTQEVDLLLKSEITETRYFIKEDAKELDKEILKKYAINPLVYSGDFKAATVYLNQKGTIPLQRLCEMMKEISKGSIQLHPGTISKWCQECHKRSKEKEKEILEDILKERLIHADETGIKINGEQYWIHVLTNKKGAYYIVTKQRGDKERGAYKYLELYTGIVVHDHFSMYLALKLCQHAECNAHIDRYLKAGIDFDHNKDCKKLLELLHEMLKRKYKLIEEGKNEMPTNEIQKYEKRYQDTIEKGLANYKKKHPGIEKKYEPDYVKTFRRMLIYQDDHLRFIKNFAAPYTNNKAELQCRAVKAKKNSSKQFITENGGASYASILSILQTAKIKNENALEMLECIFN